MKKGWEYKKLGEVCRKSNNIKWDDVPNDASYRYIDLTSVDRSDLCIHNPQYIKKDNAPSRAKQIIKAGDIIFATTRPTLRRVSLIDEKYDGDICSTGFCVLRPNVDVKSKLIFYALLEDGFYKYIEPLQTGANYPAVTDNIVKNYIIPIPPLSEQQSIVDYLDSAFAKIDTMKANAEKALNEAKALFQASLKEMLEPKEGWEEKKLGDIAEDSADGPFGSNLKKEHYTTEKEVRIIQLSNIGEDGWREENTKYTTFEHLKNISRSEVEPNDIVIAKMMPAGRAILCPSHEPKFVLSSDAVKIKLKKGMETRFILHSINSPYFRNEVYENVTGSGRVRTSLTKLRACSIFLPPLSEQQSIVTTLDSLKSKVDRLQAYYEKISQECDALKQAILRQVFE